MPFQSGMYSDIPDFAIMNRKKPDMTRGEYIMFLDRFLHCKKAANVASEYCKLLQNKIREV